MGLGTYGCMDGWPDIMILTINIYISIPEVYSIHARARARSTPYPVIYYL